MDVGLDFIASWRRLGAGRPRQRGGQGGKTNLGP